MDAITLYKAIEEVCPVQATEVDVADDRSTWSFTPRDSATTEQIAAGENVVATIPVDVPPKPTPAEILYDHEERLRAVEVQTGLREAP